MAIGGRLGHLGGIGRRAEDLRGTSTVGMNCSRGMAVSKNGTCQTLAHEIGHTLGMRDVYVEASMVSLGLEETRRSYFDGDWNGGCDGPVSYDGVGTGSARYYERGRLHRSIVAELLMCGISDADTTTEGRDLSFGPVFGIGTDGLKYKVDCGAFNDLGRDNVRSPTHQ